MNKIPSPAFNDAMAFTALAGNTGVSSYPLLGPLVPAIHAAYTQYVAVGGNAFYVTAVALPPAIAGYLKHHYKSPNRDLLHISSMREETGHAPCPMCGSFHSGTLDHLLPKNGYPEFAIFSQNLVPACKCNSKRKETLIGAQPSERILHPYFDACLSERLIGADFSALGAVPSVSIKLQVPGAHPEYAAINFHVNEIINRSGIKKWLIAQWATLCRKPSLAVRDLRRNPGSIAQLQDILVQERDALDDKHGSKNNWNSVFVTGLLEPTVITWLYTRMTVPGRLDNDPL